MSIASGQEVVWFKAPNITNANEPIITGSTPFIGVQPGGGVIFAGTTGQNLPYDIEQLGSPMRSGSLTGSMPGQFIPSTGSYTSAGTPTGFISSGSNDGFTIWRITKAKTSDYFTGSIP